MSRSTVKTLKNVCRTCMEVGEPDIEKTRKSGTLVSIHNEHVPTKHSGKITILELIKESAPQLTIEFDDMLPKFVCRNCLDILNNIHDFQQMSIRNEDKMRDLLKMRRPSYETDPLRKKYFKTSDDVVAPIRKLFSLKHGTIVVEVSSIDAKINEGITDSNNAVVVERDRLLGVKEVANKNDNICMDHQDEENNEDLCPGISNKHHVLETDILENGSLTTCAQDGTNLYKETSSINDTNNAKKKSVKGLKIKQRYCQSKTNTTNAEEEFISSKSQSHINPKIHNKSTSMPPTESPKPRECHQLSQELLDEIEQCNQYRDDRSGATVQLESCKKLKMPEDLEVVNVCNENIISDEETDQELLPNEKDSLREALPDVDKLQYESGIKTRENNLICDQCGKQTKTRLGLKRHKQFHQLKQIFACDECGKSLSTRANLERHTKNHASDKQLKRKEYAENGYKCAECGMHLKTLKSLRRHQLLSHEKDESKIKFRCQYCNKVFQQSTKLQDHIRTHTGERPFLCSICGKVFPTQRSLDLHYRRHGSELKYQCPECPKRFRCGSNMSSHKANVHSKERPHVCDVCGARFKKPYALRKHKITHGEKMNKCDFCDMRFARPDQCRRHMRIHTGEKPYKCKYCDRAYIQSNDMIKHMRVHLGDNVYRCELCPQAFRLLCELRLHFSTHKDDDEDTKILNLRALKEEDLRIQEKNKPSACST